MTAFDYGKIGCKWSNTKWSWSHDRGRSNIIKSCRNHVDLSAVTPAGQQTLNCCTVCFISYRSYYRSWFGIFLRFSLIYLHGRIQIGRPARSRAYWGPCTCRGRFSSLRPESTSTGSKLNHASPNHNMTTRPRLPRRTSGSARQVRRTSRHQGVDAKDTLHFSESEEFQDERLPLKLWGKCATTKGYNNMFYCIVMLSYTYNNKVF